MQYQFQPGDGADLQKQHRPSSQSIPDQGPSTTAPDTIEQAGDDEDNSEDEEDEEDDHDDGSENVQDDDQDGNKREYNDQTTTNENHAIPRPLQQRAWTREQEKYLWRIPEPGEEPIWLSEEEYQARKKIGDLLDSGLSAPGPVQLHPPRE